MPEPQNGSPGEGQGSQPASSPVASPPSPTTEPAAVSPPVIGGQGDESNATSDDKAAPDINRRPPVAADLDTADKVKARLAAIPKKRFREQMHTGGGFSGGRTVARIIEQDADLIPPANGIEVPESTPLTDW